MKINRCFYTPGSAVLDKASRVKEWVCNATEVFIQFCTDCIWLYLENDSLRPHLQKINQLCIYETPLHLEVHLKNISIILKKDPALLEFYLAITQDVKDIQPDLLKIHRIADECPDLLKAHFQTIQNIGKLKTDKLLLKIYLKTIKNHPNNGLIKHISGTFASHHFLKNNRTLQELFFSTLGTIWELKLELVELHLQSVSSLCNSKPLLLEPHLLINRLICYLGPSILEIHLSNINDIEPQFLENYINTTCSLNNDQQLLKVYIQTVFTTKKIFPLLKAHQQNTQNICRFQSPLLEIYLKIILQLENNKNLLEHYIYGIYDLNHTQNSHLLKPHFQNVCTLSSIYLISYIQAIHTKENHQDKESTIYHIYNITYLSRLQPDLLNLYLEAHQTFENNQRDLSFYGYNTYFISQKYPEILKNYFITILFLKNMQSNLSSLHLENIRTICNYEPSFLIEYISKILWIETHQTPSYLFYISSVHISYLIQQKHSELIDLYHTIYKRLENKQEDLFYHVCNIYCITQKYPQLLKDYLETILFLINRHPILLWPHIQNIYCSDPNFFNEYLLKTSDLKNKQELLVIHICNPFNIDYIENQHPLLLELYHFTSKALENNLKTKSYHIYNTYLVSILLTKYLKKYLETIQKMIPINLSQDDPKWVWLSSNLQSIQGLSFEDSMELEKHLQLISQMDTIFEGKAFFMEEILKNMEENEKKEFISVSPAIMPYVITKAIFLYAFHAKYNKLVPCFFNSKIKQEIGALRKEEHKLQKTFNQWIDFNTHWNEETQEDPVGAVFKKIQTLWVDATQGENNLFMLCWKEAATTLDLA